ncbi:S24 family peptidase [Pseudomonas sp. RGM 3321]|uniref:LexA family protein n=1 Tax=Pseudomonas sp. RGM 3321 TaxID=2930089 RepID=UPI001FCA65E5|nr:S24 family peptidase [Pseudomonas sp. RGM 3321]MCJ2375152.1 S24 family peptidase [Pseudomonas sp. RGM 3321]
MDISEIRRINLQHLTDTKFGGVKAKIAAKLEREASYIARCLSLTVAPENRKKIGEDFARHIEERLGLERYALDSPSLNAAKRDDAGGGVASSAPEPSNVGDVEQPTRMYRYPVVSWVAAGEWSEAVEPGGSDEYEITDYKAKGPAFWLDVKGDSMTAPTGPSVPEDSQILVDTRADVRPGKLVIAKLAGSNEATFKKLVEDGGVRYLKPLNPAYPTVQCSDDCKIIGVVVRSLTKFA